MYPKKNIHNYNIINDYTIKFPYNHPYNKPNLDNIKFIVSNNNLITNPKYIIPLINTSVSITGQYPNLIKAKKSVASFKLRKNNPVGIITTLRNKKAFNFLDILKFYIIPRLIPYLLINKNFPIKTGNNNSLFIGFNNITLFTYLTPLSFDSVFEGNKDTFELDKTGGYIQIKNNYKLPKYYKNNKNLIKFSNKYFYSSLYFPVNFK